MTRWHTVLISSWLAPSTCRPLGGSRASFLLCWAAVFRGLLPSLHLISFLQSLLQKLLSVSQSLFYLLVAEGKRVARRTVRAFWLVKARWVNLWHLWGRSPKPPSILKLRSVKSLKEDPNYASLLWSTNRYNFAHLSYWFPLEGLVAVFTWCKLTHCESLPLTFLSSIYPKRLCCGQGLWLS